MTCACSTTSAECLGPAFWVPAGTTARFILETLAAPTAPGVDLTDATPYLRIRTSPTSSTIQLDCSIGDGLAWLDQEAGVLIWDVIPADFASAAYTASTPWYYEFGYALADGSAYIPDQGIGELYLDKVRPASGPSGLQIAWMPYLRARAVGPDGSPTPIYASTAYVQAALSSLLTEEELANSAGDTTLTLPAGSRVHSVALAVTGAARTSIIIAGLAGAEAGDILRIAYQLPATAGIVLELRNSTADGTLLDTLTTDTSGDAAALELTFDGSAWGHLRATYPSG